MTAGKTLRTHRRGTLDCQTCAPPPAAELASHSVARLQAAAGNRATTRLLQTKLVLGAAHDPYEHEADVIARHVVASLDSDTGKIADPSPASPRIARAVAAEDAPLDLDHGTESAVRAAASGGRALDDRVRAPMERAFGTDFSGVRVHTGGKAQVLNRQLGARAFTTGSDIFFDSGAYDPGSKDGQHLLAHELTHVIQQTAS